MVCPSDAEVVAAWLKYLKEERVEHHDAHNIPLRAQCSALPSTNLSQSLSSLLFLLPHQLLLTLV